MNIGLLPNKIQEREDINPLRDSNPQVSVTRTGMGNMSTRTATGSTLATSMRMA